ncbi:hypothetical protein MIND_00278000 [Mycena indigotica]|uniref:Uncharacterized protein n=1 Tax=Mycena indigotica TaxID=2126181 RepID=A0A8H6WHN5_9AGAR|nr:uncharacterized protein MIND_00278000 [Mycena indigotica]KAF7312639.1 hypothetical protein MIND_00278000 [Mycena indigotica]
MEDEEEVLDTGTDGPPIEPMEIDQSYSDPALKDFTPKLKAYLRRQLLALDDDVQLTKEDLLNVIVEKDLLYTHATMKVNYTTYDDSIDPHCYWYGEILGIFHVYALLADHPSKAKRMEFLWVRWFRRDMTYTCGLKAKRFPRLGYMPHEDPDAFGFLDPQDIVRGSHLIPAFRHGRTTEYLPKSVARPESSRNEDWRFYYVNMVVDRDMLMRYHDNVIGHHKITPLQLSDDSLSTIDNNLAVSSDQTLLSEAVDDPSSIEDTTMPLMQVDGDNSDSEEEDADWRGDAIFEQDNEEADHEDEPLYGGDAAVINHLGLAE